MTISSSTHSCLQLPYSSPGRSCWWYRQGRLSPQQPRRYSSFPLPSPFPSFPLPSPLPLPLVLPSLPFIPLLPRRAPLKPARGSRCKLPQWGLRGKIHLTAIIIICILYIPKFVKLLIKSPKLSLAHLSPTVERDRRPWMSVSICSRFRPLIALPNILLLLYHVTKIRAPECVIIIIIFFNELLTKRSSEHIKYKYKIE